MCDETCYDVRFKKQWWSLPLSDVPWRNLTPRVCSLSLFKPKVLIWLTNDNLWGTIPSIEVLRRLSSRLYGWFSPEWKRPQSAISHEILVLSPLDAIGSINGVPLRLIISLETSGSLWIRKMIHHFLLPFPIFIQTISRNIRLVRNRIVFAPASINHCFFQNSIILVVAVSARLHKSQSSIGEISCQAESRV